MREAAIVLVRPVMYPSWWGIPVHDYDLVAVPRQHHPAEQADRAGAD
jgi:hypothetical protein